MTTDRLAALLHQKFFPYAACIAPNDPYCHACHGLAARLAAAGVTVAQTAPDLRAELDAVTEYEAAAEQFANARGKAERDEARPRLDAAKRAMDAAIAATKPAPDLRAAADDAECPTCDGSFRHEWPCPAIQRCQHPSGCGAEATCGTPTPDGYKRVCGTHFMALRAALDSQA